MRRLRQIFYKNRKFYDDDFDWDNYTADSYERRLIGDVESRFDTRPDGARIRFDTGAGALRGEGRPMHPNAQLILEMVGRLRPASVHEVGCGGGDHVAAVHALYPGIAVTGGDRGRTQLELARARHPELAGRLGLQDITMPFSRDWPRAELVYTQAVIMHIHTAVSHFVALANMVRQSARYVLLVENAQCHNFVRDIEALAGAGHLDWPDCHLHEVTGSTGARAILLSAAPLELPVLRSDLQLREGAVASARRLRRADEDSDRAIFGFRQPG